MGSEGFNAEAIYSNQNDVGFCLQLGFLSQRSNSHQDIDDATRSAVARVSNINRVLASRSMPNTDAIVLEAYEWAVEQDSDIQDMLLEDVADALIAAVTAKVLRRT
jgi:exosome complex component RRP4